jgi:hypothetical protein
VQRSASPRRHRRHLSDGRVERTVAKFVMPEG